MTVKYFKILFAPLAIAGPHTRVRAGFRQLSRKPGVRMSLESSFFRNSIFVLSLFSSPLVGQLQFGGSSSSPKNPSIVDSSSPGKNDTDNRFFFDGPGGLPSTGNEALDGGIIGLGVKLPKQDIWLF